MLNIVVILIYPQYLHSLDSLINNQISIKNELVRHYSISLIDYSVKVSELLILVSCYYTTYTITCYYDIAYFNKYKLVVKIRLLGITHYLRSP